MLPDHEDIVIDFDLPQGALAVLTTPPDLGAALLDALAGRKRAVAGEAVLLTRRVDLERPHPGVLTLRSPAQLLDGAPGGPLVGMACPQDPVSRGLVGRDPGLLERLALLTVVEGLTVVAPPGTALVPSVERRAVRR